MGNLRPRKLQILNDLLKITGFSRKGNSREPKTIVVSYANRKETMLVLVLKEHPEN